jgi:hypothetical protein
MSYMFCDVINRRPPYLVKLAFPPGFEEAKECLNSCFVSSLEFFRTPFQNTQNWLISGLSNSSSYSLQSFSISRLFLFRKVDE